MGLAGETGGGSRRHAAVFPTTRWSVVVSAGSNESKISYDALSDLCASYWYPLYAYARRRGYAFAQAEDLTQGFFARFLEKGDVRDANPTRGRFRSFLLASFKHFLANEWDRTVAQKRGGGAAMLSLDFVAAEGKYGACLAYGATPDQEYERQWALAVLEESVGQLEREYAAAGKDGLFARIQAFLPGATVAMSHRQCAEDLGMTEAAVKMAVHRLRARYRKALRQRIADTLDDPESVDDEIRYLLNVLGA